MNVATLAAKLRLQTKLQAVLDRLFKRLWQIKAFKPLLNVGDSQRRAPTIEAPLLELNANDNAGASQVNSDIHAPQEAKVELVNKNG